MGIGSGTRSELKSEQEVEIETGIGPRSETVTELQ